MAELRSRCHFSVAAAITLLWGATLVGCGGGSNNPNSPTPIPSPTPSSGNIVGVVASNHPIPHVATLTVDQLRAGVGVGLDISNGFHTHTVFLSGPQVVLIAGGGRVAVVSSTNPHSDGSDPHGHLVTFN